MCMYIDWGEIVEIRALTKTNTVEICTLWLYRGDYMYIKCTVTEGKNVNTTVARLRLET